METTVGVQVLVTANNAQKYLNDSLKSILPAVKDLPWVLIFHDDGSTDDTVEIAYAFAKKCGADSVVIERSSKHCSVGGAKNKTFQLIDPFRKKYPWICVHDSDDIMYDTRITGLLEVANETGSKFVHGDYYCDSPDYTGHISSVKQTPLLGFGVWATLFHESIVPKNEDFFRTDLTVFEDYAKWWDLRYVDEIDIVPADGVMTTHYIKRDTSMTYKVTSEQIDKLKAIRAKVYKHPLVT